MRRGRSHALKQIVSNYQSSCSRKRLPSERLYADSNEICPVILNPTNVCHVEDLRIKNLKSTDLIETKIYPNPTADFITFEKSLDLKLKICNIIGELLIEENINSDFYHLDVKNLASGIYIIYIGNSNNFKSYKLIKT